MTCCSKYACYRIYDKNDKASVKVAGDIHCRFPDYFVQNAAPDLYQVTHPYGESEQKMASSSDAEAKRKHEPEENTEIRQISSEKELAELNFTMEQWGFDEGWNIVRSDLPTIQLLDPYCRFAVILDGQIVSSLCPINMNENYSFIGAFVTKAQFRGGGIGSKLFAHALAHAGSRTVGLYSFEAMVGWYARHGFVSKEKLVTYTAENLECFAKSESPHLVSAQDIPSTDLAEFDRKYFPSRREKFLQAWIRVPNSSAFAFVDDGRIRGYGAIRKCESGSVAKLGPLYAESPSVARELITALFVTVHDVKKVVFETMEENNLARELAAELGLSSRAVGQSMYRNGAPPVFDKSGIYAFTSGIIG